MPTQSGTLAARIPAATAAALIAGASGLHALWGTGSAWPARDRRELAELVAGTEDAPGSGACFAVAALLAGAAAVVVRAPDGPAERVGKACVAGVFALRGAAGLTGSTGRLVPWTPSARFVERDRRYYGPLCVSIAALVAVDLVGRRRRTTPRGDAALRRK